MARGKSAVATKKEPKAKKSDAAKAGDGTERKRGRPKIEPTIKDPEKRKALDIQYEQLLDVRNAARKQYDAVFSEYTKARDALKAAKKTIGEVFALRATYFPADLDPEEKREAEIRALERKLNRLREMEVAEIKSEAHASGNGGETEEVAEEETEETEEEDEEFFDEEEEEEEEEDEEEEEEEEVEEED